MFDDLDQMRGNSYKNEQYRHYCLSLLVNLVVVVNEYGNASIVLEKLLEIIFKAWEEQATKLSYLGNTFRNCSEMNLLIKHCASQDKNYENVLDIVCKYKNDVCSAEEFKISFRIFENLFKHSKIPRIDVNKLGGLDVLLNEWRSQDNILNLTQFLNELSNLWKLYRFSKSHSIMMKRNVPTRFFTLTFITADNVKYYIVIFIIDNEVKIAVINSVTPTVIAKSNIGADFRGQSQNWTEKTDSDLSSNFEEPCRLAPLYNCTAKAGIEVQQTTKNMSRVISAIEPMQEVDVLAAQLSKSIVKDEISNKLSRIVFQWSIYDVLKWFYQIGFDKFANSILDNQVDGDLLLRLTEDDLKNNIGMDKKIVRIRFMRELYRLKQSADYSIKDSTDLNSVLTSISSEYSVYTYSMLVAGVNRDSMRFLTDEQLKNECGISNVIHRRSILAFKASVYEMPLCIGNTDKPYDVFISYRKSTASSHLASLLKVNLKIRNYKAFIDMKRLKDDKSRRSVLQAIKQSKNFIIVLTPESLNEYHSKDSLEGKIETIDLICKEVATAKLGQCNIIPVLHNSNFSWPGRELIPEDLHNLSDYNSISWSHEYQEASIKKLLKFMC